jgi:transcription elongation factor Elf1
VAATLSFHGFMLSYCAACDTPTVVGLLMVKGWRHQLPVCGGCLQRMAQQINESTKEVLR